MGTSVLPKVVKRDALLSEDKRYRYWLQRVFDCGTGRAIFCMLNPSTATAEEDDPTIRRCMGFTAAWGLRELLVVNLFAFRATLPKVMKQAADPVGPENDHHLLTTCLAAQRVICAWGQDGSFQGRDRQVMTLLLGQGIRLEALRLAKNGGPWHPLYLPTHTQPIAFGGL